MPTYKIKCFNPIVFKNENDVEHIYVELFKYNHDLLQIKNLNEESISENYYPDNEPLVNKMKEENEFTIMLLLNINAKNEKDAKRIFIEKCQNLNNESVILAIFNRKNIDFMLSFEPLNN